LDLESKKKYPAPIYIEFLDKKIQLPETPTKDEPILFWVKVYNNVREHSCKEKIPYNVTFHNQSIINGTIVYLPADEKNVELHISSCNINYESNIEFKNYLIKNDLYRPGKYFDKTILQYLYNSKLYHKIDVWIQLGDNIYESLYLDYKDGNISIDKVLEIQKLYYINTYNEDTQSIIMRNCINLMIQDNNEYASRIGQSLNYSYKDPFFRNYFEIIYENIIKKYQLFLYDKNIYSSIRQIGFYKLLFLNNIYSFYYSLINLDEPIQDAIKQYLSLIGTQQNAFIFMSRALENYSFQVSNKNVIKKSNTYSIQFEYYTQLKNYILSNQKSSSFIFGGDNHSYFLKKHLSENCNYAIYDACSSGFTVIDSDDDFDENKLSIILNNNKETRIITYLKNKEYNTLICKISENTVKYSFYSYNSQTNSNIKKEKCNVPI
jgi:hypothetical protein